MITNLHIYIIIIYVNDTFYIKLYDLVFRQLD